MQESNSLQLTSANDHGYIMTHKVVINSDDLKFSACHFLKEPRKCSRLHGHNYYVSVEVLSELDENHFVIDFIELKAVVKDIAEELDHFILVPEMSDDLKIERTGESVKIQTLNGKKYLFPSIEVKILPLEATTSELLAKYVHQKLIERYPGKKIKVIIEESKSTFAVYED